MKGSRRNKTIENSRIGKGGGSNIKRRGIQDIASRNRTIY
jgi:hypothetical protein